MKDVNKVILIGHLGADPIQRETKSGIPVVHFPMATSRRLRDSNDAEGKTSREETQWHRVVAWGKQGEVCAQYLKKGQPVYIEGMIRSHKYDGKDGVPRVAYEVHVDNVSFLSTGRGARNESAGEALAIAN